MTQVYIFRCKRVSAMCDLYVGPPHVFIDPSRGDRQGDQMSSWNAQNVAQYNIICQ
jgi:hypothetical protein